MTAFYLPDGDAFVATEHTRGPWSPVHQHGGPVAGLIGRALEGLPDGGVPRRVARVTVDLVRPVPIGRLEVRAGVTQDGRMVQRVEAEVRCAGKVVCTATGVRIRVDATGAEPVWRPGPVEAPLPEACEPFVFPFFAEKVGYHRAIDLRLARGVFGEGPVMAWFRPRMPLVAGETTSPLCRVLIASDSGNGISPVLDWRESLFMNPDLTVTLHREPRGEWVALDAATVAGDDGLGLASSVLLDEDGPIGHAAATLLLGPR